MDVIVDLKNSTSITPTLEPKSRTANTGGTTVNCVNHTGRLHVIASCGAIDGTFTLQMRGNNDGGTAWTALADAGATCTFNPALGTASQVLDFPSEYSYVRGDLAVVQISQTLGAVISVEVVQQKEYAPAGSGVDRSPST